MLLLFVFSIPGELRVVVLGLGNAVKLYNPNGLDPAKTTGKHH